MTSIEIYQKHLEAFRSGEITIDSSNPRFDSAKDAAIHINSGGLIPGIWNQCMSSELTVNQGIYAYLFKDLSKRAEAPLKKKFLSYVNYLLNKL